MSSHVRAATNAEQFQRALNILAWFRNNPGASYMEAAADLGVPTPQIKNELNQLTLCGLPGHFPGSLIEVSMDQLTAAVEFSAGLDKPVRLTPMEAGVTLLALEAIRHTVPADKQPAVASAMDKIQSLLPAGVQPSHGNAGAANAVNPLFEVLTDAIAQRQAVDFDYLSYSSDSATRRTVSPDYLSVVNGKTYLWARQWDASPAPTANHKKFAVERMDAVRVRDADSAGEAIIPAIEATDPFGFDESEEWAHVAVAPNYAWMLEYYPFWLVEDAEPGPAGELQVIVPWTGEWTTRLLIAFSLGLSVKEPLGLDKAVRHQANLGLKAYAEHLGIMPSQH